MAIVENDTLHLDNPTIDKVIHRIAYFVGRLAVGCLIQDDSIPSLSLWTQLVVAL